MGLNGWYKIKEDAVGYMGAAENVSEVWWLFEPDIHLVSLWSMVKSALYVSCVCNFFFEYMWCMYVLGI